MMTTCYDPAMDYPDDLEVRFNKYAQDLNFPVLQATDYLFACEAVLETAKKAYEGCSNFSTVRNVTAMFERVVIDQPVDCFPGYTAEELEELSWLTNPWFEILQAIGKSNPEAPLDNPTTLRDCMLQEITYYNYTQSEVQPDDGNWADIEMLSDNDKGPSLQY